MSLIKGRLRDFKDGDDGNVMMLLALMFLVLLGSAGLAIEHGRVVNEKTRLQDALDAAVLAGAMETSGQVDRAAAVFDANVVGAIKSDVQASFVVDADGEVTGTIDSTMKTPLASIFGHQSMPLKLSAAAAPSGNGVACILLLDPNANQSLLLNSGAYVSAPTCEVHVKTTGSPAAIFNSGTTLNTQKTCIQGSTIIDNGGTHPNVEKSCETANDPFAGTLPVPSSSSCDFNNKNYNGGTVTMTPGVYCGHVNFNSGPTVTFQPGVYVIKNGGWNVNGGTWTGNGVTFYYADDSKIQFNSAVTATLTAPTSGSYDGILFYEAQGLSKSQLVFDDSKGFNTTGLFYLPSRNVTWNSGSGLNARQATMVFNQLLLNGTNWNLSPSSKTISTSGNSEVSLLK